MNGEPTTPEQASDAPAPRRPLPPLPEGLSWPRPRRPNVSDAHRTDDDYDRAPEFNKWRGLESYLKRVWKPFIPYIDMPTMRDHWPAAATAIDRQRSRLLLKGVALPLKLEEVNDRALESRSVRPEDAARLGAALGRRRAKEWRKITNG